MPRSDWPVFPSDTELTDDERAEAYREEQFWAGLEAPEEESLDDLLEAERVR